MGDFAFWAEMPDVAQVINDVQGKDEEDTAARQLAAYRLLNALVNANADRIGQLPWPPRERALYSAYTRLIYKRVRPNESGPRDRRIMAQDKIAVIGLGYVGLPVALAFAKKFPGAIGFDIHEAKVAELKRGYDRNHEVSEEILKLGPENSAEVNWEEKKEKK